MAESGTDVDYHPLYIPAEALGEFIRRSHGPLLLVPIGMTPERTASLPANCHLLMGDESSVALAANAGLDDGLIAGAFQPPEERR
jgi:hypothetical protein